MQTNNLYIILKIKLSVSYWLTNHIQTMSALNKSQGLTYYETHTKHQIVLNYFYAGVK